MKKTLALVLLAAAVLLGPVVWQFLHFDPRAVPASGLPWQIDILPGGEARVFDLTLGRSTLSDARARFGIDMQVAVVAEPDETGNVEGYYEAITAGFVAGKLIVTADLPAATNRKTPARAALILNIDGIGIEIVKTHAAALRHGWTSTRPAAMAHL